MRCLLAIVIVAALAPVAFSQTSTTLPRPIPPPPPPSANPVQPLDPNAPPRRETFSEKSARCLHHGGTQGVPAGQIGQYTRECANSQ